MPNGPAQSAATLNIDEMISIKAVKVPLEATTKKEAIWELIELLAASSLISKPEQLKEVVWQREQQRTTGIGEGLAIPHGKCDCSDHLVMAAGRPENPIDFDSVDKKPVQLVLLLASPPAKTADHIQALGKISRMMVDPATREAAFAAESAEELYTLIRNGLA